MHRLANGHPGAAASGRSTTRIHHAFGQGTAWFPATPCNAPRRHHVQCMAHTHHPEATPFTGAFRTAITLAELLQRVEAAPATIGAGQDRALVQHLGVVLDELPAGAGLQKLLDTFPAAAMVYENRHYGHAGLCRAPLEQSLNSELAARSLIEKVQATRA